MAVRAHRPSVNREGEKALPRVGLLARDPFPSPSPVQFELRRVGFRGAVFVTHSGGTAPVSHRTSLLCPYGHPRRRFDCQ
jgi:hypothetical protein